MGFFDGIKKIFSPNKTKNFDLTDNISSLFQKGYSGFLNDYLLLSMPVIRVAKTIADEIKQIPFSFSDVGKIKSNRYKKLLENPNVYMNYGDFLFYLFSQLESFGIVYIVKIRSRVNNEILELYPLGKEFVTYENEEYYKFNLMDNEDTYLKVEAKDVFKMKLVNPKNPYSGGKGLAEYVKDELSINKEANKYINEFLQGGGMPAYVVSLDGARKAELENAKAEWMRKEDASRLKAHFVNYKMQMQKIQQNFQELQIIDIQKYANRAITSIYRVPPEVFGDYDNANRNNISDLRKQLMTNVIAPRLKDLEMALNKEVFEGTLTFPFVSTETTELFVELYKVAPYLFEINEFREKVLRLPPIEGAEGQFALPINIVLANSYKTFNGVDKNPIKNADNTDNRVSEENEKKIKEIFNKLREHYK